MPTETLQEWLTRRGGEQLKLRIAENVYCFPDGSLLQKSWDNSWIRHEPHPDIAERLIIQMRYHKTLWQAAEYALYIQRGEPVPYKLAESIDDYAKGTNLELIWGPIPQPDPGDDVDLHYATWLRDRGKEEKSRYEALRIRYDNLPEVQQRREGEERRKQLDAEVQRAQEKAQRDKQKALSEIKI